MGAFIVGFSCLCFLVHMGRKRLLRFAIVSSSSCEKQLTSMWGHVQILNRPLPLSCAHTLTPYNHVLTFPQPQALIDIHTLIWFVYIKIVVTFTTLTVCGTAINCRAFLLSTWRLETATNCKRRLCEHYINVHIWVLIFISYAVLSSLILLCVCTISFNFMLHIISIKNIWVR